MRLIRPRSNVASLILIGSRLGEAFSDAVRHGYSSEILLRISDSFHEVALCAVRQGWTVKQVDEAIRLTFIVNTEFCRVMDAERAADEGTTL